jgi:malonyl-CoA decarboxylase
MARPREFDVDAALDGAIAVFREHGFEGSSAQMLVDAMGIGRQSLYATFGDKWRLYCSAARRYGMGECAAHFDALRGGARAIDGITVMLRRVVETADQLNMAPGGISALMAMRSEIASHLRAEPKLKLLDADLKHLFASWFNRGFVEHRRIDRQTPAAVLEKLIAYEALHEIKGWDDLRRRLAPDRRCFGFFHPALPGEPLIFVEVALVKGLATAVQPLLSQDTDEAAARERAARADTAIFYSISNCQDGLRGVAFGNFLIKQVVGELKAEIPQLKRFSTLSPVPGFRQWLDNRLVSGSDPDAALLPQLDRDGWWNEPAQSEKLRVPLLRLCARYLTRQPAMRIDPVARSHLGNGARLERINWLGNTESRALQESFGIIVNYLYDHDSIEDNHEAFVHVATIARSGGCRRPAAQHRLSRHHVRPPPTRVTQERNHVDEQTKFFDRLACWCSGFADLHSRHGRKCSSSEGAQRRARARTVRRRLQLVRSDPGFTGLRTERHVRAKPPDHTP